MAKPINLANVNITIQQFQQIASGKFNAGEVKLKSEHSLDIINNHVRSRDENVKTISHDEVLAIKQAFVRALSQNGVGPDALNDIRRRIGLAPDPSLPVALAQRSMKPLSRQQIRSILDEHKETINNVAGNGTIRTHAEIYARHGNEALQRYEQTRRATNEEFMRGRNLDSDRRVLDIQRVIAGDIHFRNDADRRLLVSAAEMLRSEILRLSNGNPPDDPLGTITYKRGNGLRITLGLGMSQKAFVDKLDDMLLQLRADRPTPQSALDALDEYRRAKAGGAAGKANWLASLLDDPRGGFKARTVAVAMLAEIGIGDYESLSLLNKVSDQEAQTFLSFLMVNPEQLHGQTLRDSAAFQRLADQAAANVQVPEDSRAFIPVQSPDEFNRALEESLHGNLDTAPLRFKRMAEEVRAELLARFGAEAVPARMSFVEVVTSSVLFAALRGDNRLTVRATPETLKARLLAGAQDETARRFLTAALKPMLRRFGLPEGDSTGIMSDLLRRHPNILQRLLQTRNPAEAASAVSGFRNEIDEAMRRNATVRRFKAQAVDFARAELARLLGVPVASLEGNAVNLRRVSAKASRLAANICGGEDPANTDQEIEAKFRELAAGVANERATLLRQADQLRGISPQTRDEIKRQILNIDVVTGVDLAAIRDAAANIQIPELEAALEGEAPRNDVLNALGTAGERIKNAALAFVHAHNGSPDLLQAATKLMCVFAACERPGLTDKLDRFMNRVEMFAVNLTDLTGIQGLADNARHADIFLTIEPDEGFSADNRAIADGIANGRCPPLAAQAIGRALEDLGIGNLPAEEKAALLSGPAGQALAQQVRRMKGAATPTVLRSFAWTHFANAAAVEAAKRFAAGVGGAQGFEVGADVARRAQEALFARFPDLAGKVATAITIAVARGENVQAAADAVLQPYSTVAEIGVRAFREVAFADAHALEMAAAGIAEKTGLDENAVRDRLDLAAYRLDGGGVLAGIRDSIARDIADPNVALDTLDDYDIAGIQARCNQELDRFIEQKAGVITAIGTLPIGDAMKGELATQALAVRSWKDPALVDASRAALADQNVQNQITVLKNVLKPVNLPELLDEDVYNLVADLAKAADAALANALPAERRAQMGEGDWNAARDILFHALFDQLGAPFVAAAEALAAAGRFRSLDALAAGKATADAAHARRFLNVAYANLVNDWTTNDLASRFNAGGADGRLKARVRAAVAKGPELLAKHSAGLDAGQKAALKAFIATLDLRDSALADSEWAIRMKLVEFRIAGEGFTAQGSPAANEARALGYAPSELPKLQRVADLYRQATGCTDAQAYVAALDPKSDARRLFACGGRFATSVENFSAGLRLQREFKTWFADACAKIAEKKLNRAEGGSVTVVNANAEFFKEGGELAFEKFLFEEIARNEAIPIDAEDVRAVFDMEANPATRFMGRGYTSGCLATFAQIPPEKRSFIYRVFDMIGPVGQDDAQARARNVTDAETVLARILRHYDAIAEMDRNGTLTREIFFERFFPEVPDSGKMTNAEILTATTNVIQAAFGQDPGKITACTALLNECGVTSAEAVEAVRSGKSFPRLPYVALATVSITDFGTSDGARSQAVLDLRRPAAPMFGENGGRAVSEAGRRFKAVFPDNTTLTSGNAEQAGAIADKLAQLCGDAHPAQTESLYLAFTQGAGGNLVGTFADLGIRSSEHMPVVYTLSKNAETGAITVRYSEPDGFPVKFSWETTIDVDGTAVSTPFVATVGRMPAENAREAAAVAAKRMNRTLNEEQLARAAELLEQHCVEMNVKNATLFANFVVQLPLDGDEKDILRTVSMANSIRQWRDIEPGDPSVAEVEAVVKDEAIDDLADFLGPGYAAQFKEPNPTVFNTFQVDLGRATVVIGDRIHEMNRTNNANAIADFKNALAGKPNAQKAVSCLMHQGLAMHTARLRIKMGLVPTTRRPNPLASYAQPGAEKFVNRTGNPALFPVPQIVDNPTSRYELHVSDDGNTATVRHVWSGGINVGVELKPDLDTIGSVDVIEEITLDLTNDNPRITNVRLGQKISA